MARKMQISARFSMNCCICHLQKDSNMLIFPQRILPGKFPREIVAQPNRI